MMTIRGKRTKRPRPSDLESARAATSSSTTNTASEEDDQDMAAHCLILLAQGGTKFPKPTHHQEPLKAITTITSATAYECKTCSRCFPSFQALGGHRASHNKPRLPPPEKAVAVAVAPPPSFTVDDDHQDYFISKSAIKEEMMGLSLQMACGYNSSNTLSASNTKPKVHACSICGAEFSSGQALGGHMRRHRPLPSSSAGSPREQAATPPRNQLCLDLNLPADEQEEVMQSPKFTFGSNDNTLVFAASLVDCRY